MLSLVVAMTLQVPLLVGPTSSVLMECQPDVKGLKCALQWLKVEAVPEGFLNAPGDAPALETLCQEAARADAKQVRPAVKTVCALPAGERMKWVSGQPTVCYVTAEGGREKFTKVSEKDGMTRWTSDGHDAKATLTTSKEGAPTEYQVTYAPELRRAPVQMSASKSVELEVLQKCARVVLVNNALR